MADEQVFRSTRVVTPQGERPAAVAVSGGTITAVLPYDAPAAVRRAAGRPRRRRAAARPGRHPRAHQRPRAAPPGRASRRATAAAAAGGITTLVDMPLNSIPPTTTPTRLERQARAATAAGSSPTSASGAARSRATSADLEPLHDAGVFGFKCFLLPSGVDEFPQLIRPELAAATARSRPLRRAAHRTRRGPRADRGAPQRGGRALRRLPRLAAAAPPRSGPIAGLIALAERHGRPGARPAPVVAPRRCR